MNRQRGFALVTSLLVMIVIAALGVGAVFLSNMNLRIAENTSTQAIARFSAESGLDQSFVILAAQVLGQGNTTLPADVDAFNLLIDASTTTETWEVEGYQRFAGTGADGADQAQIRIRGIGPRNAAHVVEALVEAVLSPVPNPDGYSLFGEGFVALGDIDLAGNGTFDINFVSGSNIDLRSATLVAGNTAGATGTTCRWGAPPRTCETGQAAPDVPLPVFTALRDSMRAKQDPGDLAACESPLTGTSTVNGVANQLICLASGATLTVVGSVDNLVIIGDETTTVILDAQAGQVGDDMVDGVTVVSASVDFGGNAAFYGSNTIVALNDITFGKNVVSNDGTARTFIVTEGDFTLSGTGATDIFASFWVGQDFIWQGTPDEFRGTIVAGGSISGAGCGSFCTVRPPDAIDNDYIPITDGDNAIGWGVGVLSRR